MKKSFLKIVLMVSVPVAIFTTVSAKTSSRQINNIVCQINQGPDLSASLQAVEQRIATLKQSITTKPQYKQHRSALSSLENKKNALKADIKASKDKAQIERDLKSLEEKVSALEAQLK